MNQQPLRDSYTIALCSDIHCGDPRFSEKILLSAISEINAAAPDLVLIAGDLTADGYREQFETARGFIEQIENKNKLIIAGNHDGRNVGWVHFEDFFGPRFKSLSYELNMCCRDIFQENLKIVAADSSKPDINDGEIGRRQYQWIRDEFSRDNDYKIFALHHHLVSVPGTGRERNIVWDAGDVLEVLRECEVDLVLCGHKHVPYVWTVNKMIIVNSGTMGTFRTRGYSKPSYNLIKIDNDRVTISTCVPDEGVVLHEVFDRMRTPPPLG